MAHTNCSEDRLQKSALSLHHVGPRAAGPIGRFLSLQNRLASPDSHFCRLLRIMEKHSLHSEHPISQKVIRKFFLDLFLKFMRAARRCVKRGRILALPDCCALPPSAPSISQQPATPHYKKLRHPPLHDSEVHQACQVILWLRGGESFPPLMPASGGREPCLKYSQCVFSD